MIDRIRPMLRAVILFLGACAVLTVSPRVACAQPSPPALRLVVPAPPGGNMDATARLVAGRLSVRLAQPVVVDNRPGAQTAVGTELVVRAPPDGNTLLIVGSSTTINPALMKLGYDALTDLAPVRGLTRERYALAVRKELPVATLDELLELLRSRASGLSCAAGPGVMLLACGQLRVMTRSDLVVVPFNGADPAAAALLGGHADLAFLSTDIVLRHLDTNRWRVLAMADAHPARPPLPAVPALPDRLPGFTSLGLFGLMAPARTPRERIERLSQAVADVMAEPVVQEHFARHGHLPLSLNAEDFGVFLRQETQRVGGIVRDAGIKAP